MESTVRVRYVGRQPVKRASTVIEKCAVVWDGHGDIQEVTEAEAKILLNPKYKDIWAKADVVPPAEKEVDPPAGSGTSSDGGTVPTDEEVQKGLEEIIRVVPKLKPSDFDPNGRPKVTALSDLLKRKVTKIERDAAWQLVQESVPGLKAATERAPE